MHPSLVVEYVNEFSDELVQYMAENLSPRVSYLLHKKLRRMVLPWKANVRQTEYDRISLHDLDEVRARVTMEPDSTWSSCIHYYWIGDYPTKEEAMTACDERLLGHDIVLLTEEDMR